MLDDILQDGTDLPWSYMLFPSCHPLLTFTCRPEYSFEMPSTSVRSDLASFVWASSNVAGGFWLVSDGVVVVPGLCSIRSML